MSRVTWGDDTLRIRLFKTATRLSTHFYDATAQSSSDAPLDDVEELNRRWLLLKGDKAIGDYEQLLEKELLPLEGQAPFDHIRTELAKPFEHDDRIWELNRRALTQVRECIETWGGLKAKKRIHKLKLLPLRLVSTDAEQTRFFFERSEPRILIRVGSERLLLRECLILEFSLFHEYLSHAFPNWSKDVEPVSEGWLFALEFDWFESQYTLRDIELLRAVWHRRFARDRRSFWAGMWLLKRCHSRDCVRKFLLEWVAGWDDFDEDDNLDLLSQLQGVYSKSTYKFGGKSPDKVSEMLTLLESTLCGGCPKGTWDIHEMAEKLSSALGVYDPSKGDLRF